MKFEVSFEGDDAKAHRLPARDGARALLGLAKSISIATEYMVEGEVRQRYPFSAAELYFEPPTEGSWRIAITAALSSLAVNVGSSAIYDFAKYTFDKAAGRSAEPHTDEVRHRVEDAHGGTEAVINNIKPHLSAAHDIIGAGANEIIIFSGAGQRISFDEETKAYIKSERLDSEIRTKWVGVGSLNANSRFGKVFDFELGHVVTIEVARDIRSDAMIVLGDGLSEYIRGNREATVEIKFLTYQDYKSRPTKYLILDAVPATGLEY